MSFNTTYCPITKQDIREILKLPWVNDNLKKYDYKYLNGKLIRWPKKLL